MLAGLELSAGLLYRTFYAGTQPAVLVPMLRIMALALPLNVLLLTPLAAIKARMMMGYDVLINSGALALATIVLAIVLRLSGASLQGLTIATVLATAFAAVLALVAYARKFDVGKTLAALRRFEVDREMLRFSIRSTPSRSTSRGS
jgi:hypothetical protein